MIQFDRQYRLSAGPAGSVGFEIGETSPESPTALHISFSVEKADTETPNMSKISLWNLSPEHLAVLNEKDCVVTLKAGYGNMIPLIFVGTVTYIETMIDAGDRETAMELEDGRIALRDSYVSQSFSGKINSKKIIEDIAADMGIAATFSYNAKFYDFPNGYSYVGPGRVSLDKACASSGLRCQIQDGILQLKMARDTMTREVYLLDSDSGLLDIPKKVKLGKDTGGPEEQAGWEVTYLMNGAIGIGDYVRLESKIVKGYFRVLSVIMEGDNIEGGWTCTARLIAA